MRIFFITLGTLTTNFLFFNVTAKDYRAQIGELHNELFKIKQQIDNHHNNKAYFQKGKGLSVKSVDGKYEFKIKGRAMFDMTGIFGGNSVTTGNDPCNSNCSRSDNIGTWGNEFRRLRFSIIGRIGDGWGFAFQPDFAETVQDNSNFGKGIDVKDAFIYKTIKGLGKISIGNVKSAGGLWENTSSNSLLFMERPMYNEAANLAHRAGIHYDSFGSLGNLHSNISLTVGNEGAWRQEQEDSDSIEDRWNISGAIHYTIGKMNNYFESLLLGKNHKLLIGASWSYEAHTDSNQRDIEARANGVHTLGEKIQDGTLININNYAYGGPQLAYTNGPLFLASEWFYVSAGRKSINTNGSNSEYDDYNANGYSTFVHYFFNGNSSVPISEKKASIGSVDCKSKYGCTAFKVLFESLNFAQDELSESGTDGKILHFGLNHYFNYNVRIMLDFARGIYQGGNGYKTDDQGTNVTGNMTSIQTRLHVKW